MTGPGKYDEWASLVREGTVAEAVIVIVVNGKLGSGFSVQTYDREIATALPAMLRQMAREIEKDYAAANRRPRFSVTGA